MSAPTSSGNHPVVERAPRDPPARWRAAITLAVERVAAPGDGAFRS